MSVHGETVTITDILNAPDKMINSAENDLSRFFRQILFDLNIGPKIFRHKVRMYLSNPANGIGDDPVAQQNHRGNLMKELAQPRMTWQVFMKALRIIDSAEIKIDLYLKNGTTGVVTGHVMHIHNYAVGSSVLDDLSRATVLQDFPQTITSPNHGEDIVETGEEPDNKRDISDVAARMIAKYGKNKA